MVQRHIEQFVKVRTDHPYYTKTELRNDPRLDVTKPIEMWLEIQDYVHLWLFCADPELVKEDNPEDFGISRSAIKSRWYIVEVLPPGQLPPYQGVKQ
jgi:hypothetical protein